MLAFLCQDGAEQWDQRALVTSVGGENGLGFGECSENDVGEGLSEAYRRQESSDGELILAGLDGGVVGACENAVYA